MFPRCFRGRDILVIIYIRVDKGIFRLSISPTRRNEDSISD